MTLVRVSIRGTLSGFLVRGTLVRDFVRVLGTLVRDLVRVLARVLVRGTLVRGTLVRDSVRGTKVRDFVRGTLIRVLVMGTLVRDLLGSWSGTFGQGFGQGGFGQCFSQGLCHGVLGRGTLVRDVCKGLGQVLGFGQHLALVMDLVRGILVTILSGT